MKKSSMAPRGNNIMSKIVAQRDVSITSAFKDEEVPAAGVLTDHEAELSKILSNINTWGLDVFTGSSHLYNLQDLQIEGSSKNFQDCPQFDQH